jgi:hypothetical protein
MPRADTKPSSDEARKEARAVVHRPGWIALGKGTQLLECSVWDESENGARLAIHSSHQVPDEFYLYLSMDFTSRRRCRIAWRSDKQVGVEFLNEPAPPG